MAFDKVIDSTKLNAGMTATANAIRAKTGGTSPIAWDDETGFKTAVEVISNGGGIELPELGDAAAQPTDIVRSKILYDDQGNPVTGTMQPLSFGAFCNIDAADISTNDDGIKTLIITGNISNDERTYIDPEDSVVLYVEETSPAISCFGDAKPEDVVKGKKFTSAAGLLMEGKHECEGGVELPDLGDTAAQPSDIVEGKVLYDDEGNPVTGNIPEFSGDQVAVANFSELYHINNFVRVTGITSLNSRYDGLLLRPGTQQRIFVPDEEFGDARQEDVVAGKYFTSSNGLKLPGTHVCEGSVELPELGDTAAQPTDIAAGKVLYDEEGNPVIGTLIEANEVQEKLFATSDYSFGGTPGSTVFHVSGMYNGNLDGVVVRPGAGLGVRNAPTDFFGDATPNQVAKGATFTSAAGLLVEGTHECETGVQMRVEDDTLYITGDVTIENETLIL